MFCFGTLHALWFKLPLWSALNNLRHLRRLCIYSVSSCCFPVMFKWASVCVLCVKQCQFSKAGALVV